MIEEGDYVRSEIDGIGKVILIKERPLRYAIEDGNIVMNGEAIKHSKNMIDLIEEDDIILFKINGVKFEKIAVVKKYHDSRIDTEWLMVDGYKLEQIKILKVLTHEQFELNCYRLED